MQRMRKLVKEQNIYRWAGNLIADLCSVRIDHAHDSGESQIESRYTIILNRDQPIVWQGSVASLAIGRQLPTAHEAHRSIATRSMATRSFEHLILNFFQCSRKPHFPEPDLDVQSRTPRKGIRGTRIHRKPILS